MVGARLDRALKAAGIPIVGVSIGDDSDRATWSVQFAGDVTKQQQDAAAAVVATFDPESADVISAEVSVEAISLLTDELRAVWLFWFRETFGKDPTDEERVTHTARLIQAVKDVKSTRQADPMTEVTSRG